MALESTDANDESLKLLYSGMHPEVITLIYPDFVVPKPKIHGEQADLRNQRKLAQIAATGVFIDAEVAHERAKRLAEETQAY